jgi:flagellar motor switch protein FliG
MALRGYEKVAVFLGSIGEEAAAEVLKGLDMKDIGKITMHMNDMKPVDRAEVEGVLKEASEKIDKGGIRVGGMEFVKKILNRSLGEEGAGKILEITSKEGTLEALRWVDPKTLVNFLVMEHPQTIALTLSLLEPVQAAEVFTSLPNNLKTDVASRIATTERIPESAIEELDDILKSQLEMTKGKGKRLGGTRTMAEILNQCDKTTEQLVLDRIEEQNEILAEAIRQLMFVFDDLVNVDDRGIQLIMKEVSSDELSLALKTASEALKEKMFKNMSQRAAQILKEEMEIRGPVKVSDVEKAQQNIVRLARKLETEGKLVLAGKGDEGIVV